MRQWFSDLGIKEARLVIGGGIVLLLTLLYLLAWRPLATGVDRMETTVQTQRSELRWMQDAAREVMALRGRTAAATADSGGQSLLAQIDQSAKQKGIAAAVKRIEPEGNNKARIRIEQVAFDQLAEWLVLLEDRYGITVDSATVERQGIVGVVDARLTLSR